ncbi:MAG: c-type cytochrome [Flavisolibacter sp.]|jgi:nitric oxide reductase subunit C
MIRVALLLLLIALYSGYSLLIYTKGTESQLAATGIDQQKISDGKRIYQQYNCQACHQVYGLGGYLGPELTTAYSDKNRGEKYMRALLSAGGNRMPNFHFSAQQIDALIAYLKYVDTTATPIKQVSR